MPRSCSICVSPNRSEIEAALLDRRPFREIGKAFGISHLNVYRHSKHIASALARSDSAREHLAAEKLIDRIQSIGAKASRFLNAAESVLEHAEREGDHRLILSSVHEGSAAVKSAIPILELEGRLSGELTDKGPNVNVGVEVIFVLPERVPKGCPGPPLPIRDTGTALPEPRMRRVAPPAVVDVDATEG